MLGQSTERQSPLRWAGAISAAKTGTTAALQPIPTPRRTRKPSNDFQPSTYADPIADVNMRIAENMIALRRPKNTSFRASERNVPLEIESVLAIYADHILPPTCWQQDKAWRSPLQTPISYYHPGHNSDSAGGQGHHLLRGTFCTKGLSATPDWHR